MRDLTTNSEMSPAGGTAPIEVSVPIGISVANLSTVMASISGLYKEVGKDIGVTDVADLFVSRHWEGSLVIECSPVLTDDADPLEAERVSRTVLDGLEQLTIGTRPTAFTNAALRHAAKLSSIAKGNGIAVKVTSGGRSIECARNLEAIAKDLINLKTKGWGSVEGTVQMISTRGTPSFNIYEVLTDKRIGCLFDIRLLESVIRSLESRVVVYGEIYSKGAEIEYVKVDKIRRRLPSDKLPGFADIRGIFTDSDI